MEANNNENVQMMSDYCRTVARHYKLYDVFEDLSAEDQMTVENELSNCFIAIENIFTNLQKQKASNLPDLWTNLTEFSSSGSGYNICDAVTSLNQLPFATANNIAKSILAQCTFAKDAHINRLLNDIILINSFNTLDEEFTKFQDSDAPRPDIKDKIADSINKLDELTTWRATEIAEKILSSFKFAKQPDFNKKLNGIVFNYYCNSIITEANSKEFRSKGVDTSKSIENYNVYGNEHWFFNKINKCYLDFQQKLDTDQSALVDEAINSISKLPYTESAVIAKKIINKYEIVKNINYNKKLHKQIERHQDYCYHQILGVYNRFRKMDVEKFVRTSDVMSYKLEFVQDLLKVFDQLENTYVDQNQNNSNCSNYSIQDKYFHNEGIGEAINILDRIPIRTATQVAQKLISDYSFAKCEPFKSKLEDIINKFKIQETKFSSLGIKGLENIYDDLEFIYLNKKQKHNICNYKIKLNYISEKLDLIIKKEFTPIDIELIKAYKDACNQIKVLLEKKHVNIFSKQDLSFISNPHLSFINIKPNSIINRNKLIEIHEIIESNLNGSIKSVISKKEEFLLGIKKKKDDLLNYIYSNEIDLSKYNPRNIFNKIHEDIINVICSKMDEEEDIRSYYTVLLTAQQYLKTAINDLQTILTHSKIPRADFEERLKHLIPLQDNIKLCFKYIRNCDDIDEKNAGEAGLEPDYYIRNSAEPRKNYPEFSASVWGLKIVESAETTHKILNFDLNDKCTKVKHLKILITDAIIKLGNPGIIALKTLGDYQLTIGGCLLKDEQRMRALDLENVEFMEIVSEEIAAKILKTQPERKSYFEATLKI